MLAEPVLTIDLWPALPPGSPAVLPVEELVERSANPLVHDRALRGIARPRLVVFRPVQPNGAALLVIPGGAYRHLAIDKEGFGFARWLAAHGFTAFVLLHRLPGEGWADRANVPLADAQRAMRLVRHRARDFGVDPARLAAIGFSAGGHACADLAARFDYRVYAPLDAADERSARPFCAAPIYPVVSMDAGIAHPASREKLLGPKPTPAIEAAHSPDQTVTATAPPHFLLAAEDDDVVPIANTLNLHAALRRNRVPVELHLFAAGGHGFGVRQSPEEPVSAWPAIWLAWAKWVGLV